MYLKKVLNQVNRLLTKEEKIEGFKLLLLVIIMGVFDVVGVASVFPFMSIAADPNFVQSNEILLKIYNFLEFDDHKRFVMLAGICVIGLLAISTFVKLGTTYALYKFTFSREHSISVRLLTGYLNQPYSWYLNQHSSELSKSVLADVREVISRNILSILVICSFTFQIILIITLLILVDPATATITFLFFAFVYTLLYLFVKGVLDNIGVERLSANSVRFRNATEIFGLIKEIKILGKENFYLSAFGNAAKKFVDKEIVAQSISSLPKFLIEMIIFTALITVVLINLADDVALNSIVPIIALYAFAVYRLVPALQVVFANISLFRSSAPVLDFISEKYSQLNVSDTFDNNKSRLNLHNEIAFREIDFRYPKAEKLALEKISLKIPANNIIGIIGSTGSGKTTLIDILLGLLTPNQGTLHVDGVKICEANVREWQRCIGYVPQHISLVDDFISANIALGEHPNDINMDAVISAAKIANIHDFILSELENGYDTRIGEKGVRLSGGQRQRLGIARALYNKPNILVLDEATSALDGQTEKAVMDAVNNLGRKMTLVIIAHRLDTLAKADIVYKLEKGRICSHGSYEVMSKTENS
ncbi:ATP-binding cassette domain-containing protein [Pseudomonadales bacterium]|nr:ATP-binding cassette domain-containing protein [Pseudomonadales bacterium]